MEEWKNTEYLGYEVSSKGNIRENSCIPKYHIVGGYYTIHIPGKMLRIHRLVAEAFIPNPYNLPCVLHLDNNPLNNDKNNLVWGTQSDNIKQCVRDGRHYLKGRMGSLHPKSKRVLQCGKDGNIIKEFGSFSDAARSIGLSVQGISMCVRGEMKYFGGFIWKIK